MKPHLQFLVQILIDVTVTVKLPRIVREYNKGAHTKSWLSSSLQTLFLFYMSMHVCPCFRHLLHQLPIVLAKCKETVDEGVKTSVQLFNRTEVWRWARPLHYLSVLHFNHSFVASTICFESLTNLQCPGWEREVLGQDFIVKLSLAEKKPKLRCFHLRVWLCRWCSMSHI